MANEGSKIPCEDCITLPICMNIYDLKSPYTSAVNLSRKCTIMDSFVYSRESWHHDNVCKVKDFFIRVKKWTFHAKIV